MNLSKENTKGIWMLLWSIVCLAVLFWFPYEAVALSFGALISLIVIIAFFLLFIEGASILLSSESCRRAIIMKMKAIEAKKN